GESAAPPGRAGRNRIVAGGVEQYHRKTAIGMGLGAFLPIGLVQSLMATSPDHPDLAPRQPEEDAVAATTSGSSRGSWLFLGFLAILGLLIAALVFVPKSNRINAPQLPRLALQPLMSEQPAVTFDDLKGKAVLLNFWGTWCAPCIKEFPAIAGLEKQYRG